MKKAFVLIVLVGILGLLLTAAVPIPPPTQSLTGTLRWQRASPCGVSDFVPLPVMTNVYLTGKFVPTNGTLQGCSIEAQGIYYRVDACTYFAVDAYKVTCLPSHPGPTILSSSVQWPASKTP